MGLTIHYSIKAKTIKKAIDGLNQLREKCLDLPFQEVREVKHKVIKQSDIDYWDKLQNKYRYPNNSMDNLQKRNELINQRGFTVEEMLKSEGRTGHVITLEIWPGEGCEACNISFYKDKNGYKASDFCKTQYAVEFVKCHLLVCSMLDIAKEVGFEVTVNDEGQYFETRDLTKLAQNINDYTNLLKSLFPVISKQAEKVGMKVESNISMSENYMKVKNKENKND